MTLDVDAEGKIRRLYHVLAARKLLGLSLPAPF
jgi:hypothetical protein